MIDLGQLERIAKFEFGSLGGPIEVRDYANQAGRALFSAHQWQFAEGRSLALRTRARIGLDGATWTEATKTITKTGAFADYPFLSADTFELTGGTGATTGTYEVASRTDDDNIVLVTSIGALADGSTDIEATMPNDQISLPSDFDFLGITAYAASPTLLACPELTSPQVMLDLRSWAGVGATIGFWSLLRHVRSTSGGVPVPRLDLYPRTDETDEELVIYYRAGWKEVTTDDEIVSIPQWLDLLFIETFKCVVGGHEEPEKRGRVDRQLSELYAQDQAGRPVGFLFKKAWEVDATLQSDMGPMMGGWLEDSSPVRRYRYDTSQVIGP